MVSTIGNPLSWGARGLREAGHDVAGVVRKLGGEEVPAIPQVRGIGAEDLRAALKAGAADFAACRSDVLVLAVLYPVIGACLVYLALHQNVLPLIFPLASGFALLGPAAAVGLYEMSRRRERGEAAGWLDGFAVVGSASFGAVFVLALALLAVFILWMMAAYGIFLATMGPDAPATVSGFVRAVFTTAPGLEMMAIGVPVGFVFALAVLATSVVSFPLLIDRDVGLPVAVATSWRVFRRSPVTVLTWGAIVAAALVVGMIPMLLGLVIVMPVLGHATWHLYRRAVAPV